MHTIKYFRFFVFLCCSLISLLLITTGVQGGSFNILAGGISNGGGFVESEVIQLRGAIGQPLGISVASELGNLNTGILTSVSVLSRYQHYIPLAKFR